MNHTDQRIDHHLQAHALDTTQLADDAQRYATNLARGIQPYDADRIADLAARLARQAHRIDGMKDIARLTAATGRTGPAATGLGDDPTGAWT
ncbi:hypothetical protein [Kitasatospora kazusensis]|uniref:hypothetical protein n=1 Tax=Kitasatospora kazusensis TaxID=407974 RepID=UPI0031D4A388